MEGDTKVNTHAMLVQKFDSWRLQGEDIVLGWWCLSYLGHEDMDKLLTSIRVALRKGGCLILNEPILREGDPQHREKMQEQKEQQMVIRSRQAYLKMFERRRFHVVEAIIHKELPGIGSDVLMTFILKRDVDANIDEIGQKTPLLSKAGKNTTATTPGAATVR